MGCSERALTGASSTSSDSSEDVDGIDYGVRSLSSVRIGDCYLARDSENHLHATTLASHTSHENTPYVLPLSTNIDLPDAQGLQASPPLGPARIAATQNYFLHLEEKVPDLSSRW